MIKVIRLNGEILYLNLFQIEYMESIPETKIKMMNGNYYLVKDTVDSIMKQIAVFLNNCMNFDDKSK
ncbi:flagellar FlbD family protein [Enterocloster sp. OA13]|uniref:flagellar FlbD family protein n=1 Tax=Enterocloster sp. OA13 TaxID=2914161 RepID=UPI0004707C98|nr:flagellar FlbD family protein [Enterocloster sp. OA13]